MSKELMDAMVTMKEQEALDIVHRMMKNNEDPLSILQVCTQAMETVGQKFEAGDYFLPELMMAGEILKQVSDIIKPHLNASPEQSASSVGRL